MFGKVPEGGKVTIEVRETEGTVEVKVSDTGPGIPADEGDKLFEKFHQAQEKDTPSKAGFGIGLYLVKHLVETHKGTVHYESEPGKGTTFTITLRKGADHFEDLFIIGDTTSESYPDNEGSVTPVEHKRPATEEEKPKLDGLLNNRLSLLVVDDNAQMRQYIAQIFKSRFVVYEAADVGEGLQQAMNHIPDMIITDEGMDGVSGLDLCKSIKEDPATGHIPVILLTDNDLTPEKRLMGVESGADDYLTKPFENELLVARVNNILKRRAQYRRYFYNEVTLQKGVLKISVENKGFR